MPRVALTENEISEFRDRICQAVTRLFAENGYGAVTMRAIATAVGCSPMTPYRYFESKDEIFALVRAAAFARFVDAQQRAIAGVEDPLKQLETLQNAYVEFALDHPDDYRIMFELHQEPASDYVDLVREGANAWMVMRSAVGHAVDAGVLDGDPDTLAHLMWAGVHGLVSLHLAGKLQLGCNLAELIGPMREVLLHGSAAVAAKENRSC